MQEDYLLFEKAFKRFGEASRIGLQRFHDFLRLLEAPLADLTSTGLVDIFLKNGCPGSKVNIVALHCLKNRQDITEKSPELSELVEACWRKAEKKASSSRPKLQLDVIKNDFGEIPKLNAFEWTASFIENSSRDSKNRDEPPSVVNLLNPQDIQQGKSIRQAFF